MDKMRLSCDVCHKGFVLADIKTEIMEDDITIEHGYLKCPHCGHVYTVYYADVEYRQNINRFTELQDELHKLKGVCKRKKYMTADDFKLAYNAESKAREIMDEQKRISSKNKMITAKYKERYEGEPVCQK
ncbi:hypothetical protein vBCtySFA88_00008 [Clostridium phage vB_CtyS-FA88]|nr:hypothetical protein vBCtySFA88_00008 [Clostridium phage vB_CtyS-FA88]